MPIVNPALDAILLALLGLGEGREWVSWELVGEQAGVAWLREFREAAAYLGDLRYADLNEDMRLIRLTARGRFVAWQLRELHEGPTI